MDRLRQGILNVDVFAKPVQLNFRGRERFATIRGGILTLLVYFATAYLSFALLDNFIYQRDPVIQTYDMRLEPDEVLHLEDSMQ